MTNVAACPDVYALQGLLSGKLLPAEQEPILVHLESCPSCVQRMQTLSGADTLVEVMAKLDTVAFEDDKPAVARIIERLLAPAQKAERTQADEPVSGRDAAEDSYAFLAPAEGPDEIGRLGGYRVLKVLGAGGMGIVFQAEDPQLGRLVALKVIKPEQAAKPQARQRFLREARAAAALNHDHIVHIYQVGEDRGIPFLATQLLEGMSLEQRLRTGPKLSTAQVLQIGKQVALGLAAAHARGLIHRDIKPANLWLEIRGRESGVRGQESGVRGQESDALTPRTPDPCFLTPDFRVKILDFGLARTAASAGEPITQVGAIMGTPAYMAPEQARGLAIDHRADLFSLGCVLYELTTGARPFQGPDPLAVLTSLALDTPTPPQLVNLDVPAGLSDLIMQLMDKDPARRPASAQDVVKAIADLESTCTAATPQRAAGFTPAVTPPAATSRHVARGRRRAPVLAAIGLLAAGIGIAILFGEQIIRFATNQGELVIEVDDPSIEVKIVQNGVVVHDKTNKREFTLTAVKGEIEVLEKNGIKLATKRFELTRGGKTTVTVTLHELANARKAKDPDRRAALWLLSIGGRIGIQQDGKDRAIKTAGDLPRGAFELTVVDLQDNAKVSDAGLAHFKDCKNVTQLLLNSPKVSDAGLAHFKNCKQLWNLHMYKTQVSDAGLAVFKDCGNITYLNLRDTEVSDAGLAHFKNYKKLTDLDLRVTEVSDAGLAHIKDCKLLTTLDLGGTKVTEAGVKKLAAALPGCKIEWAGGVIVPKTTTDPDRKAAEWVWSIGGGITIKENGKERPLGAVGDLPRGACELTFVELRGNAKVSDAGLAHFKDCKNLTELNLSGTPVSDAGLAHFKDCKNVTTLYLAFTQVSDLGLEAIASCPKLASLNVKKTKVTEAGVKKLAAALPGCKIDWDGGVIVPKTATDPDRRAAEWVLSIGGRIGIKEDGMDRAIKAVRDLPRGTFELTVVDLQDNAKVSDAGLAHFKDCKNVTQLYVNSTQVTDAGLAYFKDCKKLWYLHLYKTQVSDSGLALFKDWGNLTYLNLRDTDVSDAGLIHFKDCKNLTELYLDGTKVNDAALTHFKDCKNLTTLDLGGTKVSDAALVRLAGFPKLESLNVKKTRVTAAGVKTLAAALPGCKIEWDGGAIERKRITDRRAAEWVWSIDSWVFMNDASRLIVVLLSANKQVSDAGLAHFKDCKNLARLELNNCTKVSDVGLAHLKDCKNLKDLGLAETKVTDAGIKHLAGLPKLEWLNLRGTKVSAAGVAELQKALPKCKIEWDRNKDK